MERCCLCRKDIRVENPVVLFTDKYGKDKEICADCSKNLTNILEIRFTYKFNDSFNYFNSLPSNGANNEAITFLRGILDDRKNVAQKVDNNENVADRYITMDKIYRDFRDVNNEGENSSLVYCVKCGNKIPSDNDFCSRCGEKRTESFETPPRIRMSDYSDTTMYREGKSNGGQFTFNGGAKVWFTFCIIVNFLLSFWYFYDFFKSREDNIQGLLLALFPLTAGILFIQILVKKTRLPFYISIGLCAIICAYNLANGTGLFSVFGFLNPIISFLVLRRYWDQMPNS